MAKKLENIKVYMCPLTEKIYAGRLNKGEDFNKDRVAVTDQALRAVMAYMDRDKTPHEMSCSSGTLKWVPSKDTPWPELQP